jgi:hypothetical protein
LPGQDELLDVDRRDDGQVILDGIDPRFDQVAMHLLKEVVNGDRDLVYVSHLSRLSRNTEKLLRTLEIILAAGVPVLTTNMLLRPNDVWVREPEAFVAPVSTDPLVGLRELRGLAGSHRKLVAALQISSRAEATASAGGGEAGEPSGPDASGRFTGMIQQQKGASDSRARAGELCPVAGRTRCARPGQARAAVNGTGVADSRLDDRP